MADAQRNAPGTTGLVLGVLGLVFGLIPAAGLVAWPLVVVGLVLGVLGVVRTRRGEGGNKGVAVAAVALSALGLAVCVAWVALFGRAASDAENALEDLRAQTGSSAELVYEVTGDAAEATISHATSSSVEHEIARPPWTKGFTVKGGFRGGTLDVTAGPGGGTITCRITVDGVEHRTATASGPHAFASCSG
ncbi:MmpS family transport accessory protein [Actinosynnema sp. NPDC091369]